MEILTRFNYFRASASKFKADEKWLLCSYILIAVGGFLRLWQYFQNRSLWQDEMLLSSSLVRMSFKDLAILPLDFEQKAPLGYLWASKVFVVLFGRGDMTLRLFPLLCGLASLILILPVCRFFLRSNAAMAVVVGILALSSPIVYHTVEAKQYSTEVLGTILSLYLYITYHNKNDLRSLFLWGLFGAIIIWFSFSSIFVLAGIAGGVSLLLLIKKDWRHLLFSMIPFAIWMVNFGVSYIMVASKQSDSQWLIDWFRERGGFIPHGLIPGIKWFVYRPVYLIDFPLGLKWFSSGIHASLIKKVLSHIVVIVPLILLVFGMTYSMLKNLRFFVILFFPFMLHFIATGLVIYPFFERLTVYLAPLLALLIAIGVERLLWYLPGYMTAVNRLGNVSIDGNSEENYVRDAKRPAHPSLRFRRFLSLAGLDVLLVFFILAGAIGRSANDLLHSDYFGSFKHWHQRELYEYINSKYQKGDAVYVYWNARAPFNYYSYVSDYHFNVSDSKDYRSSSEDLDTYLNRLSADLKELKSHKRIWVVYKDALTHKMGPKLGTPYWYYRDKDHLRRRKELFNSLGIRIDSMKTTENINLYLFESAK